MPRICKPIFGSIHQEEMELEYTDLLDLDENFQIEDPIVINKDLVIHEKTKFYYCKITKAICRIRYNSNNETIIEKELLSYQGKSHLSLKIEFYSKRGLKVFYIKPSLKIQPNYLEYYIDKRSLK